MKIKVQELINFFWILTFAASDAAPNYAAAAPAPAPADDDYYSTGNYYYNTNFNPIYSMTGGRGSGGKKANRPGWLGLIPGKQDNNGIKTNFKTSYGGKGVYTSEYTSCLSNDQNKNRGVNLVAIINGCGAGLGRR